MMFKQIKLVIVLFLYCTNLNAQDTLIHLRVDRSLKIDLQLIQSSKSEEFLIKSYGDNYYLLFSYDKKICTFSKFDSTGVLTIKGQLKVHEDIEPYEYYSPDKIGRMKKRCIYRLPTSKVGVWKYFSSTGEVVKKEDFFDEEHDQKR